MTASLFSPDGFITTFMSTSPDDIKLTEDPPLLATTIDDANMRRQALDGLRSAAKTWDIYRKAIQLSFYFNAHAYHYLLCDACDKAACGKSDRTVNVYDDEEELIRAAFAFFREVCGPETADGSPLLRRTLVGWRMRSHIWPLLVNRAIKYRIPIYRDMLTNLEGNWQTTKRLIDIATVYTQGVSFRQSPGLANLLRFWGVGREDRRPLPENIADALCGNTVETLESIEEFLRDMLEVIRIYHLTGTDAEYDYSSLVGVGVPVSPTGLPLEYSKSIT